MQLTHLFRALEIDQNRKNFICKLNVTNRILDIFFVTDKDI
jgi:hypothetical protein